MFYWITRLTLPALLLVLMFPSAGAAQATFSTLQSVHFDVRYLQGVREADAQQLAQFLESDYDSLKHQLGLEPSAKLLTRLYDTPGRFRQDINMARDVLPAMYVRGVLYVLVPVPAEGLEPAMRYQLARYFLEQARQRSCPEWLQEAYAIYHSGRMRDLSPPGSVSYSAFADLSQEIQAATTPVERNDVDFVLGRTMQFFIEKYGQQRAFGIFKEFDGQLPVEKVFKKALGQEFQDIEKAWSKYVAIKPRKSK